MEEQRKDGNYWIRITNEWEIAEKTDSRYYMTGREEPYLEDDITEIGAHVGQRPSEKLHSFAFPIRDSDGNIHQQGMTELTYIATKAMQGILQHPETAMWDNEDFKSVAESAYSQAKAMLNEQKKHE